MAIQVAFWVLMLLWLILGAVPLFKPGANWQGIGASLLPFLCVALLGWRVFGAPIH